MKTCQWCHKEITHRQNYRKHVEICYIRKTFNYPLNDILQLIGDGTRLKKEKKRKEKMKQKITDLESKVEIYQSMNQRYIDFLKEFQTKCNELLSESLNPLTTNVLQI